MHLSKREYSQNLTGSINLALSTSNWFQTDGLRKDTIDNSGYLNIFTKLSNFCKNLPVGKKLKHQRIKLLYSHFTIKFVLFIKQILSAYYLSDAVRDRGVSYTSYSQTKKSYLIRLLSSWRKPTEFRRILGNHGWILWNFNTGKQQHKQVTEICSSNTGC